MPGNTVDALNVKISADTSGLSNSIDKTINALGKMADSIVQIATQIEKTFSNMGTQLSTSVASMGTQISNSVANMATQMNQNTVNMLNQMNTSMSQSFSTLSNQLTNNNTGLMQVPSVIQKITRNTTPLKSNLLGVGKAGQKASQMMKQSLGNMQTRLSSVTAAVASAFAVNKIVEFSKSALEAGSDLTEVQNVVDTVFGSMSESVNTWAKNAMTAFGLSETSAKQYASTIGAMLKSSGIAGDALQTMSLNVASLSADMASFYNLDSQTAFEKIRSGLSGETEPLKQLGINMSTANLEAYALSQGITKSYSAMSQAEQTILRYNYLLQTTADAQHDFERTSTSWANQTRILAEQFTKLKTVIGQGLIQALTPLINIFNTLISKVTAFAQTISAAFGVESSDSSGGLSDTAASAGNTADNLDSANTAAQKLKNTISGFDELHIIDDDSTSASDTSGSLSSITPNSVYDSLSGGIDSVSEKMQEFVEQLKEKLQPVVELAKNIKDSFIEAFDGEMCDKLFDDLKTGLLTAVDIVGTFAESFDKAWTNNDAGTKLLESIGNAFDSILGMTNDVGASIAEALGSDAGIAWTESLIAKWQSLVDLVNGITTGLSAAWDDSGAGEEYIESIFNKWASMNNFLATVRATVGQVFASDVGQNFFAQMIALGTQWNDNISTVYDTFTEVWEEAGLGQSIIENLVQTVTDLTGWVTDMGSHFAEAWQNNEQGKQAVSAIGEVLNSILGLIQQIASAWRTAWDNANTTEIFGGALEAIQYIADAIENVVSGISEAAGNSQMFQKCFEAVQAAVQLVVDLVKDIGTFLEKVTEGIDWSPLTDGISQVAEAVTQFLDMLDEKMNGSLGDLIELLSDCFGPVMQTAIGAIGESLGYVADALEVISELIDGLTGNWKSLIDAVKDFSTLIGNLLTGGNFSAIVSAVSGTSASGTMSTQSYTALSASDIPQAATGGVFDKGNLFIANERGPELVGSQNGKSVVMNNQQIVDAVSSGVADAMSPVVEAIQSNQTQTEMKVRGTDLLIMIKRAQRAMGTPLSDNFAFGGV